MNIYIVAMDGIDFNLICLFQKLSELILTAILYFNISLINVM